MKVDGQNVSLGFGLLSSQQQYKEATVKRDRDPLGIFFVGQSGPRMTIDAGAGNDDIRVSKKGPNEYLVTVNGQEFSLSKEEMKGLIIKGGGGNDSIVVGADVDVAITVNGGAGDDRILNFANHTRIDGGSGSDYILNRGNDAQIEETPFIDLIFGDRDQVVDQGRYTWTTSDPFAGLFNRNRRTSNE